MGRAITRKKSNMFRVRGNENGAGKELVELVLAGKKHDNKFTTPSVDVHPVCHPSSRPKLTLQKGYKNWQSERTFHEFVSASQI